MAIKYRIKCPSCGEIQDIDVNCPCKKCGGMLNAQNDACIQLYRMGSPVGIAMGYGLYLDGVPFGHLANKQSIRIPVCAGEHKLHVTCGTTRRCQDANFTVQPNSRAMLYFKAHIKMGAWSNTIVVEPATANEMPKE